MKIMAIAMAAVVGFSAASCVSGNDTNPNEGNTILVQLPNDVVAESRAVQGPIGTNVETVLSSVTVFLLNGNTVVGTPVDFTQTEIDNKSKKIEQVSSTVNGVLVVANIPTTVATDVKALKNRAAIQNYAYTINSQNSSTGVAGKLHIGGTGTLTEKTNPDGGDTHTYKEAVVSLEALTSRFEIAGVTAGEGIKTIQLIGVFMNNFYPVNGNTTPTCHNSTNTIWNTTPDTTTSPSTTEFTTGAYTGPYNPAEYYDAYSASVAWGTTAWNNVYSYHLFAGSYVPHLILLVKGEFEDGYFDSAAGTKYFMQWVTYTRFYGDDNVDITKIDPNYIYKVGTSTQDGIVVKADELTDKPELDKFDLGIQVQVVKWTPKNVTPGV